MHKILAAMAAITFLSTMVVSDDFNDAHHNVADPITTCLNAPTRTCAFEQAMKTAISEKLSIERAKVLIAVGQAMAETGKFDDARMTLNMALEEARQSKISFAVEAKILDMAPIYAMIGDVDRAIELSKSVPTENERDRILSRAAEMAASQGDVAGARKISEAVANRRRAIWVSLNAMKLIVHNGNKEGLVEFADSILPNVVAIKRPGDKLLAMVRLSMIYKASGENQKATMLQDQTSETKDSFASFFLRARVAAAQLEYTSISGDDAARSEALDDALVAEKRIRGHMDKSAVTDEMGPALAFAGYADLAAEYVRFYQEIREKSTYLKNVAQVSGNGDKGTLASAVKDVLGKSFEMENGYEADEVRMNLLYAARSLGDLALSREIALAMQDDDNAAKALALLIPLL